MAYMVKWRHTCIVAPERRWKPKQDELEAQWRRRNVKLREKNHFSGNMFSQSMRNTGWEKGADFEHLRRLYLSVYVNTWKGWTWKNVRIIFRRTRSCSPKNSRIITQGQIYRKNLAMRILRCYHSRTWNIIMKKRKSWQKNIVKKSYFTVSDLPRFFEKTSSFSEKNVD